MLSVLLASCERQPSAQKAAAPGSAGELSPVPQPDLSSSEPQVRDQLESEYRALQSLLGSADTAAAERAQAYGDLGLLYVTYSFLEAAEVCFRNARLLVDSDYRWPYLLGYLLQIQGRLEEAATTLDSALVLRPDDVPSSLRLGAVRLELGEIEPSRQLFAHALQLDPRSAAAEDGLGKVAVAAQDPAAAIGHFERTLQLQPSASSARHALGLAHRSLGNLKEAKEHLERGGDAVVRFVDPVLSPVTGLGKSAELYLVAAAQAFSENRFDVAATNYRRAIEIDPTNFSTRKALGFSLEKLGDIDGAFEQLYEALRSGDTGEDEGNRQERGEVYRILGGLSVLHGREEKAIGYFEQSLELNPESGDARLKLANTLARAGRFEEALPHYDRVLVTLPEHTETRIRRASALINLQRNEEALAEFDRALAADPGNAEARLRYAEALSYLRDSDGAARERSAALDLSPEDRARAKIVSRQAARELDAGNFETALSGFREAVRLDPDSTDGRFELARLLGHLGRYDEALQELGRVIEEAPHHGPARRAQATALLLQQRYGEARASLQESLSALPADLQLAHALARLLASAPDDRVRNGLLALDLARRVFQAHASTPTAETLAMAHAEAGRFDEAIRSQRRLVTEAEGAGREVSLMRRRLLAFEERRAWRATSPDEIIRPTLAAAVAGSG
jgi:tetratricopeptide (TPR) repeat protein